ncbi:MAG: pyridoxamine 5'-phosphate oxidase [Alphaproteobacteria bacterium]|nr:pyridoxamine 5'-phosphate oxidase [Alphaproteobacteria bacterium]
MFDSPDPWTPFDRWLAEGTATEPRVPEAMQIATAGADGRPSVRTVLLKSHGPDGVVFYTNLHSRKGRQIEANPWAGFLLHFKGLERQIVGEGPVEPVTPEEADAYHATRPRGSQIGAWASHQSAPVEDRATLEARVAEVTARFEGHPVPRPPFWSGFRILPVRVEFWQGRPDRLHDRLVYEREGHGWRQSRLYP